MNPFSGEKIGTDHEEVALRQLFVRTAVGIVAETQIRSQVDIPESLPQSIIGENNVISLADRRAYAAAAFAEATSSQADAELLADQARAAIKAA